MGKKLSHIDKAYIAGFLDGDGTVMAIIERHKEKKFKFRVRVLLEFTQHKDNIAILEFIRKKIGSGSLSISNKRHVWKLSIKDTKVLKGILNGLKPFVIGKKKQIEMALKILGTPVNSRSDLLRMGKLADKLSTFNMKSKSRRINTSKLLESFSRND